MLKVKWGHRGLLGRRDLLDLLDQRVILGLPDLKDLLGLLGFRVLLGQPG